MLILIHYFSPWLPWFIFMHFCTSHQILRRQGETDENERRRREREPGRRVRPRGSSLPGGVSLSRSSSAGAVSWCRQSGYKQKVFSPLTSSTGPSVGRRQRDAYSPGVTATVCHQSVRLTVLPANNASTRAQLRFITEGEKSQTTGMMKYTHQHWKSFHFNVRPDREDYAEGGKCNHNIWKEELCIVKSVFPSYTIRITNVNVSVTTGGERAAAPRACSHTQACDAIMSFEALSKLCSLSQKSFETLLSGCHSPVRALIKANNVNFGRNCCVVMHDETVRKLFQLAPLCILK